MLTEKQKKICEKYSSKDERGHARCDRCPLMVSAYDLMCRGNAHYNKRTKEWEFDEDEEEKRWQQEKKS